MASRNRKMLYCWRCPRCGAHMPWVAWESSYRDGQGRRPSCRHVGCDVRTVVCSECPAITGKFMVRLHVA